jgi:hypothetical protein
MTLIDVEIVLPFMDRATPTFKERSADTAAFGFDAKLLDLLVLERETSKIVRARSEMGRHQRLIGNLM